MRNGYRIIDADTHINPSLGVLLRYADKELREQMDELKPYIRNPGPDGEATDESSLAIKPIRYNRVAGQKAEAKTQVGAGGASFLEGRTPPRNPRPFAKGVSDDNSRGRLADMDVEGVDMHFMIPGTWAYGAPALKPDLARGLFRAYHRYMEDYCSSDPRRLKSQVIALTTDPEWAAEIIREYANKDWVAAVWPVLPEELSIDDPDLEPIWQAASEADLPIMYHSFTVETPYFPGYRDIWDNPPMGRCAGQTWGAQRFLSFMLISGILDRYPNLRIGVLESGHGWLPHWLLRLTRQIDYVRGFTPPDLKHTPIEYGQSGRVFCGIDYSEGPQMTKAVVDLLGEQVLMYESDYPHPESMFPETPPVVLAWAETLGPKAMQKLMWENATRFFRLASSPW
ncbi:MAG TPA: amidohydrolase family protein [Dehalococcoidia bacterium]|nr:amidohydrolase family protein [Dehalococcoidia bacterium]